MGFEFDNFFTVRPLNYEKLKSLLQAKIGDLFEIKEVITFEPKNTREHHAPNIRTLIIISSDQRRFLVECPNHRLEEQVAELLEKQLRKTLSPVPAKYRKA